LGLGEIFVFIFFGVVATLGSAYVVAEELTSAMWISCVPVGCFACALLVVNNLRDIPTDSTVGKNTLAVRLGDARTRQFFLFLFALSAVFVIAVAIQKPAAILGIVGLASARGAVRTVRGGATGRDLIVVLGATGRAQLIFGLLFSLGLLIANS
jgi:1,4-dihydroxy-2-naphthoate octaprenyltransferase